MDNGQDYEDFITFEPDLVRYATKEQTALLLEYPKIVTALQDKYMTVKEIHELFWDPGEEEYTKTIKTVYRHMEILEDAGIVKIAGHRKPANSRLTERLYSRTAKVFYIEPTNEKWWESESGKEEISVLTEVMRKYCDISQEDMSIVREVLIDYHRTWSSEKWDVLRFIAENQKLLKSLPTQEPSVLMWIARVIADFVIFKNNPDLLDRFKEMTK